MKRSRPLRCLGTLTLTLPLGPASSAAAAPDNGDNGLVLQASDALAGDVFGSAVAFDGDTALVGAQGVDAGGSEAGAVYVLVRSGTAWTEQARLLAGDAAAGQAFGRSVSIDGDTAVIGAPGDSGAIGAAYVFVRSGTSWSRQAKLVGADSDADDELGWSVAVSGDTALVGAPRGNQLLRGLAYVFVRDGTSWSQQRRLDPGIVGTSEFGYSVALDGNRAAVGAWRDSLPENFTGSVYTFERFGTIWAGTGQLSPGAGYGHDLFGSAVALQGDTLVVGMPRGNRAFVYGAVSGAWILRAELRSSGSFYDFGAAVALDGDVLAIGAAKDPAGERGAAYLYVRNGAAWVAQTPVVPAGLAPEDAFGVAVAVSGDTVLVGASQTDGACPGDPACDSGSVLVCRPAPELPMVEDGALGLAGVGSLARDGDTLLLGLPTDEGAVSVRVRAARATGAWSEQALLVAPDAASGDEFGGAVAIEGDTLVAGAPGDHTTGGPDAGSAYVFVRAGTSWTFQKKLRASNASPDDRFGAAIAIAGDRVYVGADSANNVGGQFAGAVYVYTRSGGAWPEEVMLAPAGGNLGDRFGAALDADETRLVVGSPAFGALAEGAVHTFEVGTWAQESLSPSLTNNWSNFGQALDLDGETLLVGAPGTDAERSRVGVAYVFRRGPTAWVETELLEGGVNELEEHFGSSVTLDGGVAVVTARGGRGMDDLLAGNARVYTRVGDEWIERARLVASDREGLSSGFGRDLLLDGSTLLAIGPTPPSSSEVLVFEAAFDEHPSFCNASDGSLAACPCDNAGDPRSGCDIGQGTGGVRLDVLAQETAPMNRFTLRGSGYPAMLAPAAIVIRATALDPAAPVVFGDGLRCVGVPLVRLGATLASGGVSLHARDHLAAPGDYFYQLWFRNAPPTFCTPELFNLSNGRVMTW